MQRNSNTMYTLVGALLFSAGFATPMAIADEPESGEVKQSQPEPAETKGEEQAKDQAEEQAKGSERPSGDMVEVRISLPDGRTFVRLEPRRNMSARYSNRSSKPVSTSRRLSDGSRISVGSRGVSGGSNSGAGSFRGGGGGGGGGSATISRGGGGGGGGGGASAADSVEGAGDLATKAQKSNSGGGFSFGPADSGSAGAASEETAGMLNSSEGSSGTPSSVQSDGSSSGTTSSNSNSQNSSVPTIGEPSYDVEGNATGGQSVKYPNESMFATVIGNRVYFTGVELITSDQPFEVIVGTPVTGDSVIMDESRVSSALTGSLTSASASNSEIVIEFGSDTVVELNMLSRSASPDNPLRSAHSWTVRVR